ncbi:MAG TPA: MBL fold metallo-hydrolase [Bryobacteraceae bacterium]|jgi:glyoxylase-like metal-dependent hydrolase (beta-lactamase superfamily II)|nr:MBL fold metallo-hydrolase [Bryobacteraceae bacterium]
MEGVAIPAEQVIPLDAIAQGVRGLRIAFVNVFAVSQPDGSWTLIDAGLPFTAGHIRKWAEETLLRPPQAIVLTHGHFDHVSAARELADDWSVPIYAHPDEFPYLTGQQSYPAPNLGAGGGLMSMLSPLYPRGPIDLGARLQPLPDSGQLRELSQWDIVRTPGHTPGHASFFRAADRVLLPGDAFCTTKPESFFEAALAQAPELHGPPAYFTSDWDAARRSVRQLASLNATTVAPGHGKPLTGPEVPAALARLADEFERIAVPDNRR